MTQQARILVVEDEPLTLDVLTQYLSDEGYQLETESTGTGAWNRLTQTSEAFDVVLLDRGLPDLDGTELLRRIKADSVLQSLPVILATGLKNKQAIIEGLEAGAYYYLTKPFDQEMLCPIVRTAVQDRFRYLRLQSQLQQNVRVLGLMKTASFRFRSLSEASSLAVLLASACPNPDRVVNGLSELMINAVEHGNLGISYAEKSSLLAAGQWAEEVERRLLLPENRDKSAELDFQNQDREIRIKITDQGDGFDWQEYLVIQPERAFDHHGRGIAMARELSFDKMEYLGKGNQVLVTIQGS